MTVWNVSTASILILTKNQRHSNDHFFSPQLERALGQVQTVQMDYFRLNRRADLIVFPRLGGVMHSQRTAWRQRAKQDAPAPVTSGFVWFYLHPQQTVWWVHVRCTHVNVWIHRLVITPVLCRMTHTVCDLLPPSAEHLLTPWLFSHRCGQCFILTQNQFY